MTKLRLGILSAANIARKALIPAALISESVEVVAIASRSDVGKKFLDETDLRTREGQPLRETVKLFDSYEDMLASNDVDAVYIGLPNHLHMEWSMKAADAGKHVLCEKPAALDADQTRAIIEHCEKRGVVWMEAFMYRFHPQYEQVRKWLDAGAIGEIRTVRSMFAFKMNDLSNVRWVPDYGGGSLYDVGSYCVNVSQFLLQKNPQSVMGTMVLSDSGVDEDFIGLMDYGHRQTALFHSSFAQAGMNEVEVFGTKGSIHIAKSFVPGDSDATVLLRTGETEESVIVPGRNQYQRQVDAFASYVSEGRRPDVMSHEDTYANMRTIDALYQSAREQKAVRLS